MGESQILETILSTVKGLERRFDGLEGRFDGFESRLDGLEIRFEDMEHKFDSLAEAVLLTNKLVAGCAKQRDLEEVKADVKMLTRALTDTNRDVQNHEHRITRLEARGTL